MNANLNCSCIICIKGNVSELAMISIKIGYYNVEIGAVLVVCVCGSHKKQCI